VSEGATTGPIARIGCTIAVAETPRTAVMLNARGALPHWHWQPDDLQQSCPSVDFSRGAFACEDVRDDSVCIGEDALCIGQAPSLVSAVVALSLVLCAADRMGICIGATSVDTTGPAVA
jgi:hypothetical protein